MKSYVVRDPEVRARPARSASRPRTRVYRIKAGVSADPLL